jgi:hypothetical protein
MVKVHSYFQLRQGVDAASASFLANGKIGVAEMPRRRGSLIAIDGAVNYRPVGKPQEKV